MTENEGSLLGPKPGFINLMGAMQPTIRMPKNKKPSYFWGQDINVDGELDFDFPEARGYVEARSIIYEGTVRDFHRLMDIATESLRLIFRELEGNSSPDVQREPHLVELTLSPELQDWRKAQHELGRVPPHKGLGLKRVDEEIIHLLHIKYWPRSLLTDCAFWGSGWANFLIGAFDPQTLYSNYCVDMAFYLEHGYDNVFPEFLAILRDSLFDPHARATPGGNEWREAAAVAQKYVEDKVALEEHFKDRLCNKTAKMDRETAVPLLFAEPSIWGLPAEAIALGYDTGATVHDFMFGGPGTDVVDVGSDLCNSEVLNSFLNAGDIACAEMVTDVGLRRVYDAYAHMCARMFTERWNEPGAVMCATFYTWHILNDRHHFLRRIVLGYHKARASSKEIEAQQREADFDEAFDEHFWTTGFSRPLANACNGKEPCDHVIELLKRPELQGADFNLLSVLWYLLCTGPLEYAMMGIVSEQKEEDLIRRLGLVLARAYSVGLITEMTWLMAHAS